MVARERGPTTISRPCASTRSSNSTGPASRSSSSRRRPTRASATSRRARGAEEGQPRLRVGHLRRGRLAPATRTVEVDEVDQGGPRHRGDGAPLLRRRAGRGLRDILDEIAPPASTTSSRCAATRPGARPSWKPHPDGLQSSVELIELICESLRLLHRRRLLPGGPSGGAGPRARPALPEAQGRRRRELPDHPALLRQRGLLRLRRARARERHRRADHRGHHADHQLRADQALHEHVRRHDPAPLCTSSSRRATRRASEAVAELGVAYATLQCADLLARGAPGIHFYTLNKSPATRAILSALKACAAVGATRRASAPAPAHQAT